MKRRLLKLALFLLLGAIVNVAVAWACVLWSPLRTVTSYTVLQTGRPWWASSDERSWTTRESPHNRLTGFGVEASLVLQSHYYLWNEATFQSGWPCLALTHASYHRRLIPVEPRGLYGWRVRSAIFGPTVDPFQPDRSFVPLQPIWPGFAINTLFYAGILWLFFAAPFALRRRVRIKRGLCPACAYPIGASEVCTECGNPVKPKHVEVAA